MSPAAVEACVGNQSSRRTATVPTMAAITEYRIMRARGWPFTRGILFLRRSVRPAGGTWRGGV